jgi:hypothetical protein
MVKCKKCSKDIINAKDGCKCVDCQAQYHSLCVSETLTRGSQKFWKCVSCAGESSKVIDKPVSDHEQDNLCVLEAIAALRNDINSRWDSNDLKLDNMQKDMNLIFSDISCLKAEFVSIGKQINNTDMKVRQLEADKCKLEKELASAKAEIHELQQQARKNNIVISGVPVLPKGANVFPILQKIAQLLDLTYYRTDFNAAHWLPVREGDPRRSQPIVVSFVSRIVKNEWILARRHRRSLKAKEIDNTFPDTQIYLNEQLTQQSRTLFNAARAMMREEKLTTVWTSDGRVMVKRSPTARPYRVNHLQDLQPKMTPLEAEIAATATAVPAAATAAPVGVSVESTAASPRPTNEI